MMKVTVALALVVLEVAARRKALRRHERRGSDARLQFGGVQPALVAGKMVTIEDDWKAQLELAARCNSSELQGPLRARCDSLPALFQQACAAVSKSFVTASGNEQKQFEAFMQAVCGDTALEGEWRQDMCGTFTAGVLTSLPIKQERQYADICQGMWVEMFDRERAAAANATANATATAAMNVSQSHNASAQVAAASDAAPAGDEAAEDGEPPAADEATSSHDHDAAPESAEEAAAAPAQNTAAMIASKTTLTRGQAVVHDDEGGDDSDGSVESAESGGSDDGAAAVSAKEEDSESEQEDESEDTGA